MANWNDLPREIMEEILSRLPTESLIRFKCVRKSWYALVKNPKFVAKHLVNALQQRSSTSILFKRFAVTSSMEMLNMFSFITYPGNGDEVFQVVDIDLPILKDSLSLDIRGHSHGIICLSDMGDEIFLYNPATREFRQLPPSILLLPEQSDEPEPDRLYSSTCAVGFGYDPKSKDFKVVRVVSFVGGPGFLNPHKVEIYELSTDCWREITTPVGWHIYWAPSFERYHKGIYYWWAQSSEGREIILSFDMSEEVFHQIPVPARFERWKKKFRTLGFLNESLVLFHYPMTGDRRSFDVWKMEQDESRGGVSWSKLMRIGPLFGIEKPLLVVNSNELLMEAKNGYVILYNLNTHELKNLPITGQPSRFQATHFVKSLLSVKGGRKLDLGNASEFL